jgi:hypothetical protein
LELLAYSCDPLGLELFYDLLFHFAEKRLGHTHEVRNFAQNESHDEGELVEPPEVEPAAFSFDILYFFIQIDRGCDA